MAAQAGEFIAQLALPTDAETFFEYERRILCVYLKFLHANPHYVRLAEEVRLHDPDLYRHGVDENVIHICGRIRRGIARGDLRNLSDAEIHAQAYFMLGALTFFDRYLEDSAYPGDASVVALFVDSLRGAMAPLEQLINFKRISKP